MRDSIDVAINGVAVSVRPPRLETTLLDLLRSQGWTGAKEACAEGECGACTVAVVEEGSEGSGGSVYRALNSCLVMAPQAHGREILTVEGIGESGAEQALIGHGGSQCGYCTPGFAVSLFAEQYRKDREGPCDPRALEGNLCRCTGYRPIRDAALTLGPPPDGPLLRRLSEPFSQPGEFGLRVGGQRFHRPVSLAGCLEAAARDPEARWIAGGTDLAVDANSRRARWPSLISLDGVPEALVFSESSSRIRIGAALPLARIAERWRGMPPVFAEWLARFGSPLIRERATLGGNLCTASPIGDSAPLLMALHASLEVAGSGGTRHVAVSEFFTGYRTTALKPGELVLAVEIPLPLPESLRFYKVTRRWLNDISTVAAAFSIRGGEPVIAYGGMAPAPIRVAEAERELAGRPWNAASIARAIAAMEIAPRPVSDHRGSAEYRMAVAKALLQEFHRDCC